MSRFQDVIRVLVQPATRLEAAMQQLLVERGLEAAVGVQLDALGKLVGQERLGLDDETYRRYIRARISANRSSGTVADVLRVIGLVIDDEDATYVIEPQYPAAFVLNVEGATINADLAEIAMSFLRETADGGVRVFLEYSENTPETTFAFLGATGQGFGTGYFASVEE